MIPRENEVRTRLHCDASMKDENRMIREDSSAGPQCVLRIDGMYVIDPVGTKYARNLQQAYVFSYYLEPIEIVKKLGFVSWTHGCAYGDNNGAFITPVIRHEQLTESCAG